MREPEAPRRAKSDDPRSFIAEICLRVSEGETLNEVCKELRDFGGPPSGTFRSWCLHDKPLFEQYARARELQWEHWADRIRQESANPQIGEKIETDAAGHVVKITTGDTVDRSRLSVDSMKWLLSKLAPKKYGERVHQDVTHGVTDELAQVMERARRNGS